MDINEKTLSKTEFIETLKKFDIIRRRLQRVCDALDYPWDCEEDVFDFDSAKLDDEDATLMIRWEEWHYEETETCTEHLPIRYLWEDDMLELIEAEKKRKADEKQKADERRKLIKAKSEVDRAKEDLRNKEAAICTAQSKAERAAQVAKENLIKAEAELARLQEKAS
jgi:hypothetical protein